MWVHRVIKHNVTRITNHSGRLCLPSAFCCVRVYHQTFLHVATSLLLHIFWAQPLNSCAEWGEMLSLASPLYIKPHSVLSTFHCYCWTYRELGLRSDEWGDAREGMTGETKHQRNLSPQFSSHFIFPSFFLLLFFSSVSFTFSTFLSLSLIPPLSGVFH